MYVRGMSFQNVHPVVREIGLGLLANNFFFLSLTILRVEPLILRMLILCLLSYAQIDS